MSKQEQIAALKRELVNARADLSWHIAEGVRLEGELATEKRHSVAWRKRAESLKLKNDALTDEFSKVLGLANQALNELAAEDDGASILTALRQKLNDPESVKAWIALGIMEE